MKKTFLTISAALCLFFTSCEKQDDSVTPEIDSNQSLNNEIVLDFIDIMNESDNKTKVIDLLSKNSLPVSLETLFSTEISSKKSVPFVDNIQRTRNSNNLESYEFWLQANKSITNFDNVLVAIAPENAENLEHITAFDLQGNKTLLDAKQAPDVPVIVIEKNGFYALQLRSQAMNASLKKAGLQSKGAHTFDTYSSFEKASLETTKLDRIELRDDEEPWIKGGAEIYAITSGIRDTNNSPELKVIPMYYLDHDDQAYYPNQILLFWDEYKYQAANIQLFEQDSNYNYRDLLSIIIDGVAQIAGTLSGQSWVNALGTIGSAIINALPDSWLTDDDDYVDSFYTIEKNKSYNNYYGASGNAKVNMSPFTVLEN
ncbi:DUF3103 family protein [Aquimarina sp. 2201CG5-10]|uniref:DUF3103 family protein n=1 Tax=Aquimarina callyspongiae TaxID=3098150 RepID=UPI002AB547FF|nr:DUF3103 family protein [Aquimarina sp. 2201CG5-10]MDY8136302.1 DUF3103 family protein [Aquimarina sp. 2201CG5-10]